MTTNTEALRERFEREIGEAAPFPVQRYGDSYAHRICAWAWEGYQAGHAAAKAETAAAVAAERERAADVLAAFIPEWDEQEAVDGGDLIRMLIDAIRAGAKEPSDA